MFCCWHAYNLGCIKLLCNHRPMLLRKLSTIQNPTQDPENSLKLYNYCIQDPKSKLQNPNSKIKTPKSKIKTPRSKIRTPKSKFQNQNSKIQTPRSKIQTPRSKIQTPKSKFQNQNSKIQTPRSWGKLENGQHVHIIVSRYCNVQSIVLLEVSFEGRMLEGIAK